MRGDVLRYLEESGFDNSKRLYHSVRTSFSSAKRVPHALNVVSVSAIVASNIFANLTLVSVGRIAAGIHEDRDRARLTLSSALATDLRAIVTLCRAGFDVQARSLLRSFGEKLDLLLCVSSDINIASEYVRNSTFEGSRDFFFSNTSKARLKKAARRSLDDLLSENEAPEFWDWFWNTWRPDLDLMLGAAVHANHTVGLIAMFPHLHSPNSSAIALDGHPSNNSRRTLYEAIRLMFPLSWSYSRGILLPCTDTLDVDFFQAADEIKKGGKFCLVLCLTTWLPTEFWKTSHTAG